MQLVDLDEAARCERPHIEKNSQAVSDHYVCFLGFYALLRICGAEGNVVSFPHQGPTGAPPPELTTRTTDLQKARR